MKMTVKENKEYYCYLDLKIGEKYKVHCPKISAIHDRELTYVQDWDSSNQFFVDKAGYSFSLDFALKNEFKFPKKPTKVWVGEFTEEEIKNLNSLLCRCHYNPIISGIFSDIRDVDIDLTLTNNMTLDQKTHT